MTEGLLVTLCNCVVFRAYLQLSPVLLEVRLFPSRGRGPRVVRKRGVEYHPRRPRRACKGLTCAMKPHHRQLLAYQRQLTEGKQITAKLDSRMSRLEQVQP